MLEALTTCVGYSDFLSITAPYNARVVNRWVVVTSPEDRETALVANSVGAKVVLSERYKPVFNKGALVNDGAKALKRTGWILILDADIMLPEDILSLPLDSMNEEFLYWSPRRLCESWGEWEKRDSNAFPVDEEYERKWPASGFFQLFHSKMVPDADIYSEEFQNAGGPDAKFRDRWPKEKISRLQLASLPIHFGPRSTNWNGRKSPPFRFPVPLP